MIVQTSYISTFHEMILEPLGAHHVYPVIGAFQELFRIRNSVLWHTDSKIEEEILPLLKPRHIFLYLKARFIDLQDLRLEGVITFCCYFSILGVTYFFYWNRYVYVVIKLLLNSSNVIIYFSLVFIWQKALPTDLKYISLWSGPANLITISLLMCVFLSDCQ